MALTYGNDYFYRALAYLSIPVANSSLYRRKIPPPDPQEWASFASDGVEPSRLLARFGRNGVRGKGTSRGLRPFLSARRHHAGPTAILQPVTLAANVDGRRVMQ